MESRADQLQLLGLMGAHESAIADLYRRYAERFPEQRELFDRLVSEEVEHARLISGFAEEVRNSVVCVSLDRFSSHDILPSLDRVRREIDRADDVSLFQALSIAVSQEELLIEKQFFEVLNGDSEELGRLLEKLTTDTAAHRDRLRQAWEEVRLVQEDGVGMNQDQ